MLSELGIPPEFTQSESVIEMARIGLVRTSSTGEILWTNSAFGEMIGYSSEELQGKNISSLVPQEDAKPLMKRWAQLCAEKGYVRGVDRRYCHRDGRIVSLNLSGGFVPASRDYPDHVLGVAIDITERKRQEQELQESEARLRLVMETGRIGIWEYDPITHEVSWSKVLRELIGVDHDTPATFENFFAQILPEDRLKVDQEMREMAEIGRTMFSPFRVIHPEGSIHWLQNIGHPVRLGDELSSKYIGALVDTTEEQESLKIIEAQRVKMTATSKMTALGEMAGGLAHEINNPVAIIHGNAIILQQLAAQGNMLPDQIISMARVIAQTAERISKITRSLLAFARDAEHDPFKKASILKIVEETAEFCQERFHEHGVSFLVEEISSELEIECRPVQITQVLLNLLNNAYDAVENQADHWIRISVGDMGDRVEIYVTDSGKGIDESVREKIFQPFFTTKEVGRGTGLGLSMAAGIVESHAGTLVLDWSFPHTRFIVSLPKIQKMLEERKSPFIIDG